MEAYFGDISKPKAKAVIVPMNSVGVMTKDIISILCDYAGPSVRKDFKSQIENRKKDVVPGDFIVTTAGRLYRRGIDKIYHAIVTKYPGETYGVDVINKVLPLVMRHLVDNKVPSVAIPYMGTRTSPFDKKPIIDRMFSVLRSFDHLIEIRIVDDDLVVVNTMQDFFETEKIV